MDPPGYQLRCFFCGCEASRVSSSAHCDRRASGVSTSINFLRTQSPRGINFDAFLAIAEPPGYQLRYIFCGGGVSVGIVLMAFLQLRSIQGINFDASFLHADPPGKQLRWFLCAFAHLRWHLQCIFCGCGASQGTALMCFF